MDKSSLETKGRLVEYEVLGNVWYLENSVGKLHS
jgi:hypothetical protein